jgi:hypothetical protein
MGMDALLPPWMGGRTRHGCPRPEARRFVLLCLCCYLRAEGRAFVKLRAVSVLLPCRLVTGGVRDPTARIWVSTCWRQLSFVQA